MKYVPNSPRPTSPNGMFARTICRSAPSGPVTVFSATCELAGLTSSGSSMSASLVRPITRSCSSTGSVFQAAMSCRYFCTIT